MKKIAADLIASEMFRLLKKSSENEADVQVKMNGEKVDHSNDASDWDNNTEDNLADYLMEGDGETIDDGTDYLDDSIEDMSHHAKDDMVNPLMREHEGSHSSGELEAKASDVRLMQGLGKIEASLRRKGEGFAADLVRSTALSIQDDIVKEAAQKTQVLRELVKMASDLDRRGNREASKLVRSTIMKINR
jgi:hypothetical protein